MQLPTTELRLIFSAIREIGDEIRSSLVQNRNLNAKNKADGSLVTNLDLFVEERLIEEIKKLYPDCDILSEEAGLISTGKNKGCWIIDPIDGSRNLAHGIPHFCISVAFQLGNNIEYALVYDPLRDEEFVGHREKKRTMKKAEHHAYEIARTSKTKTLDGSILAINLTHLAKEIRHHLPRFLEALLDNHIGLRQSGSSSLDFAYLASGKYDAVWLPNAKVWDIAAGSLLVQAAGGVITDHKGSWQVKEETPILAAASPELHEKLLTITQDCFPD